MAGWFLTPTTAKLVAHYHHPVWGKYAAITRNTYGKGEVTYVGFMPSDALTEKIVEEASNANHEWTDHKDFPITSFK